MQINNAGVLSSGRCAEIDLAAHHRIIEVNVLGTVNGAHTGHRYLVATPGAMVDGMDTGATRRLGVRLTSDDVADAIAAAAAGGRGLLPKVHYPVGGQAQLLAPAAPFSPVWANRLLNKLLSDS